MEDVPQETRILRQELVVADISEVKRWKTVREAMQAAFGYAAGAKGLYPELISKYTGIAKGTVSGLVNGSGRALHTHAKRPDLIRAQGCLYLAQWELDQLDHMPISYLRYGDMVKRIMELEETVKQKQELLDSLGFGDDKALFSRRTQHHETLQ